MWYAKGLGIAVRTRLGWWAGNGHVPLFGELADEPELIAPRVGPCRTAREAIEAYDMASYEARATARARGGGAG